MRIKELLFEATLVSILNRILQKKPLPENTQQRKEIVDLVNKIVLRIQNYPDSIERFTIERNPFDDIRFEDLFETAQEIIKFIFNRGPNVSDFHKDWLFRKWLSRDIDNLHDAVEFKYDLLTFDANKARIPQGQRDINQLEPRQVREIVREFDISQQDRDDKQFEKDWVQAQSDILYKAPFGEFVLYSPQTQFAACVLGHDTDWCTAYGYKQGKWSQRTHNQFTEYNQQSPLYIFDFPKRNKKFQIHLGPKNQEYKNKNNEDLDKFEKTLLKEAIGKLPIMIILEFLEQSIDLDFIPNLEKRVKKPSELLKNIKDLNIIIPFLSKYSIGIDMIFNFGLQLLDTTLLTWENELKNMYDDEYINAAGALLTAIEYKSTNEVKRLTQQIEFVFENTPIRNHKIKIICEALLEFSLIAQSFYLKNSYQNIKQLVIGFESFIDHLAIFVAYNTEGYVSLSSNLTDYTRKAESGFHSVLIDLLKEKGL